MMVKLERVNHTELELEIDHSSVPVLLPLLNEAMLYFQRRPNSTAIKDAPHLQLATNKIKLASQTNAKSTIRLTEPELDALCRALNEISGRGMYPPSVNREVASDLCEAILEYYKRYRYLEI